MSLRDAQQIAHGLIQGYIGPDHRVIDMSSFYSALAQALQTIERPKAKYRDADNRVSHRDLNRPEQPAMIGSKRAGARATRSLAVITKTDILGVVK